MEAADIVIVGCGHGGAQAAIALRHGGFQGSILMIGAEPDLPYERPPLSKDYLAREKAFDRLLLRPEKFWEDRQVRMALGREVVAVDAKAKALRLADGDGVTYGSLIWAAGGHPRRLDCAGGDLAGVHAVRTRADVDQLMSELDGGARRIVVVGGGYIGLEAAAVLTKLGCSVVVLEALPRVLARVAGETLSRFYEAEHRAHGVDMRLNVQVECLEGSGRVTGVRLSDGELIPCDLAIVGVGIMPAVAPLLAAGAEGGNGVAVDAQCRTSLPDVFAIGDCALHENPFAGGARLRLESVQNANDQATVAAKTLLGERAAYQAIPWFWSNQYDLRLQTVGLSIGHDEVVVRGRIEDRSFSLVYLRRGKVVALDCVNATKDYVQGRSLILEGVEASAARLADGSLPLKDLLPARTA